MWSSSQDIDSPNRNFSFQILCKLLLQIIQHVQNSLIQSHDKRFCATPMERDLKLTKLKPRRWPEHCGCITPTYRACIALIRLRIYLRATIEVGITFSESTLNLHAFSDTDWAGDLDSRCSTTGYILYAAGGPISWNSKLQPAVAISTMEAEYIAAFHVIQECVWVKGVLGEMGLTIAPITLYMDSKSAICLAKNPLYHKRSKHIEIKFHWIRDSWLSHSLLKTYRNCIHGCGYFHESIGVWFVCKTCHERHRTEGFKE